MSTQSRAQRVQTEVAYYHYAQDYLRSLPPEHFMEATDHAKQREITLASLALLRDRRPDIQLFNELLVQHPRKGRRRPLQVVPDNMIVVWPEPIQAEGSYDVPLQPARPFMVLEYVSKHNKRKDYDDNMVKYEKHLQVPYYLLFFPQTQDLTLYHHDGMKYTSVLPNAQGRYAIPELELEAAVLDGWVRYWFRGELLPLPGDLHRDLDQTRQRLTAEHARAEQEKQRAEQERQARLALEQEVALLKAQLANRP